MLHPVTKQSHATLNQLEKNQGKLVHASMEIPGGIGLLSPLYKAVASQHNNISISTNLKQCLKDWKTLINIIASRPTSVLELVPRSPHYIGYVDSSKGAVGGVWINTQTSLNPTVWRFQWPKAIQTQFTSTNNKGNISINDL